MHRECWQHLWPSEGCAKCDPPESFDRTLVWCAAVIAMGTIGGLGLIAWIVAAVAR